jgi:hypothetical protein
VEAVGTGKQGEEQQTVSFSKKVSHLFWFSYIGYIESFLGTETVSELRI